MNLIFFLADRVFYSQVNSKPVDGLLSLVHRFFYVCIVQNLLDLLPDPDIADIFLNSELFFIICFYGNRTHLTSYMQR